MNGLARQHDGFESGAAHFVDGGGTDTDGDAGLQRGLTSWVLTKAGADDVAEDDFVYFIGGNMAAIQSCFDAVGSELRLRGRSKDYRPVSRGACVRNR